ncbi:MAG: hypothetical protein KKA73_09275 [Chloroflexi bacterium]|nr:hypothetical protein [Chloroflexota bacterium]
MLMQRGQRTTAAKRLLRWFGFVGIFLVLSIVGLAVVFMNQPADPVPLDPNAIAHVPPGTPTVGSIQGGRPITWTVRLETSSLTGRPVGVTDDARVYQMVEDDYRAAERWFLTQVVTLTQSSSPVDLLEQYYTGQRLQEMAGGVALFRDKGQAYRSELIDRRIEVKNFAADGRQVYLGDSWAGGTVWWYSLATGEVVEEKAVPGGMAIITMLYDDQLGRWRSAAVRTPPVTFPEETP